MTNSGAAAGRPAGKAGSRRGDSGTHHVAGSPAGAADAEAQTTDRESDDSMNVDAIKQILDLVREHELTEFELEQAGVKLRVRKQGAAPPAPAPTPQVMAPLAAPVAAPPSAVPTAVPAVAAPAEEPLELSVVTSPIVGTFYRSPDPSSPAFVEVGQRVKKGQTLCIIEAMKLMNEIESEYEGEVVKAYVENGQPVQYGERLFAVKTT
jgi:acetyl-CoA carboxylase biotin carboxyl carrier protein